ncbi:MAG: hypothetical protein KAT77_01275 [Nanoarchaeota archaeon]|nr:hypothetical protein [Nanoarchaeota archaeon]
MPANRIQTLQAQERNLMNDLIARDAGLIWDLEQLARGNRNGILPTGQNNRYDNLNAATVRQLIEDTYALTAQAHPLRNAVDHNYLANPNANLFVVRALEGLFNPNLRDVRESAMTGDWRQVASTHSQFQNNMTEQMTNLAVADLNQAFARTQLTNYLIQTHNIDQNRISRDILSATMDGLLARQYRGNLNDQIIYQTARRP